MSWPFHLSIWHWGNVIYPIHLFVSPTLGNVSYSIYLSSIVHPHWHHQNKPKGIWWREFVMGQSCGRLCDTSVCPCLPRWWGCCQTLPLCVDLVSNHVSGNLLPRGEALHITVLSLQSFGTTHNNLHLVVSISFHDIVPQVVTNLGPVTWLDCGEGQMRACAPGIENTSRLILTKEAARWYGRGSILFSSNLSNCPLPTL